MDVKEALKKYEQAKSYWSEIYKDFRDDVRFSIGMDHWGDKTPEQCAKDGLMIVPILPQFIHQVVNDMRQNTPSINVLPGEGDDADPETAKIFKGLIRNIEYKSNADEVYDTAGEYAVRGGLGFGRVDHDYIGEDSFLQELKLVRVQNPESVYLDPRYVQCDGSDAEWGIVLDTINKEDFEEKYPGKNFTSFSDKPTDTDADEITIAEMFVKEYETITKQAADDGKMVDYLEDADENKEKSKKKRKLRKVKVCRYKFSGDDLLEETTFPGKYIPIVPFHGEEVWIDGKRYLLSLIRLAKDAQRRVNKWASKESELLDMAPIAPILAPYGSVEDFGDEYSKVGDVNVIRYRQFDINGQPLNKPERLQPPPIPTGIVNAMEGAKESVKEALGMYNASVGQKSNAISGVAYDAQKLEADVATFHFGDNRNRSIQHIGRILVSAIPEVYDTARIIQIIGDEEMPQMVGVNGAKRQTGQEQEYDLTKGQYEVRVTTGASYTTKRQEAAALLGDVLKTNPELMGVFGDLWAKNLDVAGAEAMAARIRKTIPKELTAEEDAKTEGQEPPDPEKMQMAQIIEQLQAQLQQIAPELESKQGELQIKAGELAIKNREIDIKQAELQLKIAQAQEVEAPVDDTQEKLIKEREMALKEAEFQLKVELAKQQNPEVMKTPEEDAAAQEELARQQEMEAQKAEQERMETQMKAEQARMLNQTLGVIATQLNQLVAQVAQPKRVVRDESGVIMGVQ